ncbi:MAG: protein kinase [Cyanobacteria bacterium SZAS LIN-5]|nr:protein kinase [Cyanobacteria bacterium SZAS LIN-5]
MDANLEPQKNTKSQRVSWLESSETTESTESVASNIDPFLEAARATSERLEILEPIGKGGMAVVYKAQHMVMNKPVAVKLLLPHLTSDPTSLKRFQQEAQATATLSHANIVHIHDCGLSNGQAFIIMDFVEGKSLEQIVREEPLTPERAVDIFVQICEALNHAHERNIIHRDLKPSNVMLTTDKNGFDVVKVVDFGIAKLLTNDDGMTMNNLTQTGDVFGSPLYMSPEQCAGKKLDNRSDIYSLGCLMYEALTGSAPIVGKNFLDTMQKHLTDMPAPFPPELTKNPLAKKLQVIIFTCLAKDPAHRYASMKEISVDLRSAVANTSTKGGAWKEKEKSLEQIIKKSNSKKNKFQQIAAFGAAVILIPCSFLLVTDITTSSPYENVPVFQMVDLSQPKQSLNYEHDLKIVLNDKSTTLSAMPTLMQRLRTGDTLGQFYMSNGKWNEAIAEYEKLAKLDAGLSRSCDFQKYLGICQLHLNNFESAAQHMQTCLDYVFSSVYELKKREHTRAKLQQLLNGIYGVNEQIVRSVLIYLAVIAEQEKRFDVAQQYLDDLHTTDERILANPHAIESFSGDIVAESTRNSAYRADLQRLNKNPAAADELQKLAQKPDDTTVTDWKAKLDLSLGLANMQTAKYSDATKAFKNGLNEKIEEPEIKKALNREYCRALWANGQFLQAIFEKLTHLNS